MNAAREKVKVANALGELPTICASFEKGELSYSKVRAMTRVATRDNEDFLLNIAHHCTAHHMENLVSKYRRARRLHDRNIADEQYRDRSLKYHYDDDGSFVIKGRFPAEQGALILKALQLAVEQKECAGDALDSIEDSREIPGADVTAETSRRFCCDASVSPIVTDNNGEPLNIGRKSHTIPAPMRRALRTRDHGCRFPGCTHKHFIDGHHIRHWADGGETSLDNLVLLCRHHHRLVHEGGFGCERSDTGQLVFRNERGEVVGISGTAPRMKENGTAQRRIQNRLEELYIDAMTCVTGWGGTRMDYGYVTELLWCRDDPDDSDY
jgi:hypothetical protein